jgi:hypothetical protein
MSRRAAASTVLLAPFAPFAPLAPLGLLMLFLLLAPSAARAAGIDWADGVATPANPGADLGSASYSRWSVQGERITARFLLPIADAQRVAGSDIEVLVQQRVGDYLLDHLAVRARGAPCEAIDQGYDIGRVDPLTVAAGLYGFEIFFQCGAAGTGAPAAAGVSAPSAGNMQLPRSPPLAGLVLEDHALFDQLPGQVDFAQVQVGEGAPRTELFTRAAQDFALPGNAGTTPPSAIWHRYVALGFTRLLGRWDRWCLLLAAVLLTRRRRELVAVGTAIAVGYTLSLPVTLGAGLVPRGGLLGSALGLLIALLAAELIARQLPRPRLAVIAATGALLWLAALALLGHATSPVLLLLAGAALLAGGVLEAREVLAAWRLDIALLAGLFGFLDGCVLPEALAPEQLSSRALLPMVSGYDVGALLAALGVLGLLALGRGALTRWQGLTGWPGSRELAGDVATALLCGFGVFWMLSRLHG